MSDCPLRQLPDGRWWCPVCDRHKRRLLPVKARRNCGQARPELTAAELAKARHHGILELAGRYAHALRRWRAAGYPVRTKEEATELLERHCKPRPVPCQWYRDGCCTYCGCPVRVTGMPARSKLLMGSEHCPLGKW